MNNELKQYFKRKLLNERKSVLGTIEKMKRNDTLNSLSEISSELSFYDNHTGDIAGAMYDLERGAALKENEISLIKKIDEALLDIQHDTYGTCKKCGKEIIRERLEVVPYAQYCVNCQEKISTIENASYSKRPLEEKVIGNPFTYGYNDISEYDEVGFDAEDSYQGVQQFEKLKNVEDFYDEDEEYVEPIEKISNEQYRNQLPD